MRKSSIINPRRAAALRASSSISKGFTLVEVMIVVVILGLLATMVMPKVLSKPEKARRTKAQVEIRAIQSSLAMFKTDIGRFPTTAEGLEALVTDPGIKGYDKEGYLERVPTDPWGNKYIYICPGIRSKDYDLVSLGKDGEDGGEGDDADIESWNLES